MYVAFAHNGRKAFEPQTLAYGRPTRDLIATVCFVEPMRTFWPANFCFALLQLEAFRAQYLNI